jgi:hypothetical protein
MLCDGRSDAIAAEIVTSGEVNVTMALSAIAGSERYVPMMARLKWAGSAVAMATYLAHSYSSTEQFKERLGEAFRRGYNYSDMGRLIAFVMSRGTA